MRPKAAWFVTGTDTEIGKTLVTCALLHALEKAGIFAAGLKPVSAGSYEFMGRWRNDDVERIRQSATVHLPPEIINPYMLRSEMAPHLAAARERREIELAPITAAYNRAVQKADAVVVEGVGGFRVPFSAKFDSADLAQVLNIPVIMVVGLRLGCLNHALLTAEAITQRNLVLTGWVANTVDAGMAVLEENVQTLRELLPAPYLGMIPRLPQPTAQKAAMCLDFTRMASWPVHA